MFNKIVQRRWLSLPIVLSVIGSTVKVVAQDKANTSTLSLESLERYPPLTGKMHLQQRVPLTIPKDLADSQHSFQDWFVQSSAKEKTVSLSANGESEKTTDRENSQFSLPNEHLSQVPSPIIPRPPEQLKPTLPPQQEEPLKPTSPTPPTPEIRPDITGTIRVKQFEFVGNTAFSDEQLAEVTQPFTGKPITFAELLQVEALVSKKYTNAGYINSGAIVPAGQTLDASGAVVKIQIIEGGVEDIKVIGTERLNPGYIRSRLRIAASKPLNREKLLEALQLLQLGPLIRNISAELSAGLRPELSVLEVRVQEANTFNVEVFTDNGRDPSVGSWRRGVRINQANALGFGDALFLGYTNTEGSNAYDFSYTLPFNPRNGTIRLAAGLDNTEVVEPPFDCCDITGKSRYYELSIRQPIILRPTEEFALGLTVSRQESDTKIFGIEIPLSAGADEKGRTRISALRFFQDWTKRSPQQIFALRSQFSLGIGTLDATINPEPPDSRFFSWRGQAQYVRLLAPETLLVLRSDVQLATKALVPLEQIGLGGLRTVRGYRQDVLLVDNGVFASAEVRLPILTASRVGGILQVAPFLDFGVGWNNSGGTVEGSNTLLGIGLGLLWQMGDRFSARVDYGIPLIDLDSGDRTLQEKGLYFSVNYSLF